MFKRRYKVSIWKEKNGSSNAGWPATLTIARTQSMAHCQSFLPTASLSYFLFTSLFNPLLRHTPFSILSSRSQTRRSLCFHFIFINLLCVIIFIKNFSSFLSSLPQIWFLKYVRLFVQSYFFIFFGLFIRRRSVTLCYA